MQSVEALGSAGGELVDVTVKPNFRALGKRFGAGHQGGRGGGRGRRPGRAGRRGPGRRHGHGDRGRRAGAAGPDDLVVTETPRSGWAVAADGGETVALDLTVTPQLRRAGIAREVVRLVQDARKASGLEVTDRIALTWSASEPEVAEAVREHAAAVAGEVLATSFTEGSVVGGRRDDELGLEFSLAKA